VSGQGVFPAFLVASYRKQGLGRSTLLLQIFGRQQQEGWKAGRLEGRKETASSSMIGLIILDALSCIRRDAGTFQVKIENR